MRMMLMKIHESAENYLETILMLRETKGEVRSVDIATELDFTKPSVSVAMKKLKESDFIEVDKDGFITLTKTGKMIAEEMYERHKFFTDFLLHIGERGKQAVKDACRIEHVLSAESFDKMRDYLAKKK